MEHVVWVEKYRPKTVAETILPTDIKNTFQKFVDEKQVPNMILSGTSGTGKTTAAKAMLDEIGADYIMINGSMSGGIDTLRNDIKNFASSVSFSGGRKYVILDEADYLPANSTQPALRNFMEEYASNCGFILTCNFKKRIIEPLQSRCSVIDFKISKEDAPALCAQFFKRIIGILEAENVEYDKRAVAALIQKFYPDWRKTISELQRYSATGKIDSGILANHSTETVNDLFDMMKKKNFSGVRSWVGENSDMEATVLYRFMYDMLPSLLNDTQSIAAAIIILAEYQYKEAFVADPEINRAAALATIMAEVDWK